MARWNTLSNPLLLSVVIPAFNEESRIGDTLRKTCDYLREKDYASEIIVVDDGSEDSTSNVCNSFAAEYPEVRCLRFDRNHGKGYAIRKGVLASTGAYVLFCDADLATPIEEIDGFLEKIGEGVDIVIGSRALRGSNLIERQPFYRELAGKTFNLAVQLLAVPGIHDTQCGFKLMKGGVGRKLFSCCTLDGFSFDIELLFLANRLGFKTAECGVHWYHRPGSKVRLLRDGLSMLRDLLTIRFRHRSMPQYPPRNH